MRRDVREVGTCLGNWRWFVSTCGLSPHWNRWRGRGRFEIVFVPASRGWEQFSGQVLDG